MNEEPEVKEQEQVEKKPKTIKRRGRKPKTEKIAEEIEQKKLEAKQNEQKYFVFGEALKKPVKSLNGIIFDRVPENLKNEGVTKLSEDEINQFVDALVPCLDKWGLLSFEAKPEYALILVSISIISPRLIAFQNYKKSKKRLEKEVIQKEPEDENVD